MANASAAALQLSRSPCPVRKLGGRGNPEVAVGGGDDDAVLVFVCELSRHIGLSENDIARAATRQREELRAWLSALAAGELPPLAERTVILTDDGVATGYTAQAGVETVRRRGGRRVVLAVAVAPPDTAGWLAPQVDEFICLATPEPFYAVGNFFEEWPQVTDDEVRALLLAGNTL